MPRHQIQTDGRTVWVHAANGHTIGRFGTLGIDIHTDDSTACLHCSHERTTVEDWKIFVTEMLLYHDVDIPDRYMPERFRA